MMKMKVHKEAFPELNNRADVCLGEDYERSHGTGISQTYYVREVNLLSIKYFSL
jgi:hypothetical protein